MIEFPWPEYDVDDCPYENETMYLHHLTQMCNEETTCEEIADMLNLKFNHNRTAKSVEDQL